jgi:hypothetical protein
VGASSSLWACEYGDGHVGHNFRNDTAKSQMTKATNISAATNTTPRTWALAVVIQLCIS